MTGSPNEECQDFDHSTIFSPHPLTFSLSHSERLPFLKQQKGEQHSYPVILGERFGARNDAFPTSLRSVLEPGILKITGSIEFVHR